MTGLEPATSASQMPRSTDWTTSMLVIRDGFEPSTPKLKVSCSANWANEPKVEPRGVEPHSQDFQSRAYTKSAKVPFVAPKWIEHLPEEPESSILPLNYEAIRICGSGGIRTPGALRHVGFQDRCNRPTLPHFQICGEWRTRTDDPLLAKQVL